MGRSVAGEKTAAPVAKETDLYFLGATPGGTPARLPPTRKSTPPPSPRRSMTWARSNMNA